MIFAVEPLKKYMLVHVYRDLASLAQKLEWQDVYGKAYTIVSSNGTSYVWDSSKETEKGTLYGYTLVESGKEEELAHRCSVELARDPAVDEFQLNHQKKT